MHVPLRSWRHWTLRSRMVLTVAALAAVALVVADLAGAALLRSYLVGRVDDQLAQQARGLARAGSVSQYDGQGSRGGLLYGAESRLYVYDDEGALVYASSAGSDDEPRFGGFEAVLAHAGGPAYTVPGGGSSWRLMVTHLDEDDEYAVSGISLREVEATQHRLLLIDAAVTALVLGLIALAAASVVRIGLRPLTRMEQAATEIAGGNLARRVDDADPHTESGRLGTALNAMLVRIEAALAEQRASEQRMREFLADASHELRTPLTSIQGFAELYRRGGAPPGPELDEAMRRIEAEVARMRLLVGDLLLLARLDEERALERRPVDLLAVAADVVRDAHLRVPSRFVRLAGLDDDAETFEPVAVLGDESRLRQVVTNLVANALQHTPDDCEIVVRVGRTGPGPEAGTHPATVAPTRSDLAAVAPTRLDLAAVAPTRLDLAPVAPTRLEPAAVARTRPEPVTVAGVELPAGGPVAVVEVIDTGPGMGPTDARRAFERLYRVDPSRSRRHGGAGLGLAIVAAIVQAHGGRVELWTGVGQGARFRVLLPACLAGGSGTGRVC